jgi:hypothetical protein
MVRQRFSKPLFGHLGRQSNPLNIKTGEGAQRRLDRLPFLPPPPANKPPLILVTIPSPTSALSIFNAFDVQPRKRKNPHLVIALSHSGSVCAVNAPFVCGAARPSNRYKSSRPCVLPVVAVLLEHVISRSGRQENPHPIWHTGGNERVACVFDKFLQICCNPFT